MRDEELRARLRGYAEEGGEPRGVAPSQAELRRRGYRALLGRAVTTLLVVALAAGGTVVWAGRAGGHRDGGVVDQPATAPSTSPPSTRPLPPTTTLREPASTASTTGATAATSSQPTLRFTVVPTTVGPGEQVVLAGAGCRPGERVGFQWRPYPKTASVGQLAPATARGDGSFRRVWKVSLIPGQVAVSAGCGGRYSREVVLTVTR
jgi:hypothetical protein